MKFNEKLLGDLLFFWATVYIVGKFIIKPFIKKIFNTTALNLYKNIFLLAFSIFYINTSKNLNKT